MSFCGYSDGLVSDSSMLALDGWMITGPSGPHEVLEWFPLVCKTVFWGNALRDMILDPIAWNSPQCQVIHHIHDKLLSALFLLRWRNKATWRFFDFRCLENLETRVLFWCSLGYVAQRVVSMEGLDLRPQDVCNTLQR